MKLWPVAILLLGSACASAGMPGLVILDEGARDLNYELVVEDVAMAPVLPVEVDGLVEVFTDDGEILELEVGPDELVRIDVDDGEPLITRAVIGWDIDATAVIVDGEPEALEELADSLVGVQVTDLGGSLDIDGPDALYELAWSPRVDGLYAVWTLELEDLDGRVSNAPVAPGISNGLSPYDTGSGGSSASSGGLGGFLAGLFGGGVDGSGRGRVEGSVVVLPANAAELRPRVGYYMMHGKEVALSLDGQVRHGTHDGRPFASWTLDVNGEPVVQLGMDVVRVQRVEVTVGEVE